MTNTLEKENKPTLIKRRVKPTKKKVLSDKNIKTIPIQNVSFNKELLKNLKKINQKINNKIDLPNKDDQTKINSLLPIVRKTQAIGYRNIKLLKSFLTEYKKIKSRRLTKLTLKQQRQLSRSVKRARMLKLFDPRKTLRPKKFLNLEKKTEILKILTILHFLKLDNLLELINSSKLSNFKIKQILTFLELTKLLAQKNYLQ